jgi:hypothetical protein
LPFAVAVEVVEGEEGAGVPGFDVVFLCRAFVSASALHTSNLTSKVSKKNLPAMCLVIQSAFSSTSGAPVLPAWSPWAVARPQIAAPSRV